MAIRKKWAAKRNELDKLNIAKKNRRSLIQLARKHEAEEIANARLPYQAPRQSIRTELPFTSWNGFLQHKASQGNETALAILRSRQKAIEPEQEPQSSPAKDWSQHGKEQFPLNRAEIRAEYAAKEREALENADLSRKSKKQLLAVLRMEQLAAEEQASGKTVHIQEFTVDIDRKGTVVFTLSGGRILDNGRELYFFDNNKAIRDTALQYAQKKWGKSLHVEGNKIVRLEKKQEKVQTKSQQPNMER